jgi:hypothetical protein
MRVATRGDTMSMIGMEHGAAEPDAARLRRYAPDLAGELRMGEGAYPCVVTELCSSGAVVEVAPDIADRALGPDLVLVIPSLGQYKARRGWRNGAEAAYLFDLSDHSMRALDALMQDRFTA